MESSLFPQNRKSITAAPQWGWRDIPLCRQRLLILAPEEPMLSLTIHSILAFLHRFPIQLRVMKMSFRGDRSDWFVENKNTIYCYALLNLDSKTNRRKAPLTRCQQLSHPHFKEYVWCKTYICSKVLWILQQTLQPAAASFSIFLLTF